MVITAINDGEDERRNLCEAISQVFYQGKMPYRAYRLIDICLDRYQYPSNDIYDLFEAAREQDLLYKFDFLEGVAEYRYQHMIPVILIIVA